jgi:hypothetical protein
MNIYIEIDEKNENDVIIINHKSDFDKHRKLFEEQMVDFSSINLLKGNKELLVKAFRDELYNHLLK